LWTDWKQFVPDYAQRFTECHVACHSPALLAKENGRIEPGIVPMKKKLSLLQKMAVARPKAPEDEDDLSQFEKRLKMVNRARIVNSIGLGGPVFKARESESEA
jgi:hypothetical protein